MVQGPDGAQTSVVGSETMPSLFKRYSFGFITFGFFLVTLVGHWAFGWFAYVQEQQAHAQPVATSEYLVLMMRDTLENWQSEFLQLLWQVAGLAMLLYVGSPQSKEGTDRMEAKLDAILAQVAPEKAGEILDDIDQRYLGRHTDEHAEALRQTKR